MVGNNLNSSKSDVDASIAAANILLNMGFYRRATVQVHLALNILKKQDNIHDFIEFSLEFAQKLLDLYKIYWADEICLHIITICDDIFKISNPVLKTSQPHVLITQNLTAVKIKFDTLVLLIKIYKENQHNDAIALTKVLAKLMREQNKLLYSFPRDSLTLSFVPSYSNFPLVDIFEEYIANGASSFENKSLPLFHFHSLNVFLGILYSLQNNYSLADQYYIQAILKLAEYAQLLQLNKKLTVETLTIIKKNRRET